MNQDQKDRLAAALGIPKNVQRVLDVGGSHPYSCRCDVCKEFWREMGPEQNGEGSVSYGPFTREEIEGPAKKGV